MLRPVRPKPWSPTPAQRRAKGLLHKWCPEGVVRTLSPNDRELARYIAPVSMVLIRKWIEDSSEFWPWFLTPQDCDEKVYHAKDLAYEFLVEVLELPTRTDDGSVNGEILKAKMKAAEFLIGKSNGPAVQVNNNTLHAGGAPNAALPPGAIPRGLRGKSGTLIEGKIAALTPAVESLAEDDL